MMIRRRQRQESLWHPLDAQKPIAAQRTSTGVSVKNRTGVSRAKNQFRGRVWCQALKKQICLGLFKNREEAADAVVRARTILA